MYLNMDEDILIKNLSINTAKEITQQPGTWIKTLNIIQSKKTKINDFLSQLGRKGSYDIVFMGAGTSEYIGNTLVHYFNKNNQFNARSIPSTDMILNPELYVNPKKKTLFISYGRSGNSPESVGSVQAVNNVTENAYHLFITCNKEGSLAKLAKNNKYQELKAKEGKIKSEIAEEYISIKEKYSKQLENLQYDLNYLNAQFKKLTSNLNTQELKTLTKKRDSIKQNPCNFTIKN